MSFPTLQNKNNKQIILIPFDYPTIDGLFIQSIFSKEKNE